MSAVDIAKMRQLALDFVTSLEERDTDFSDRIGSPPSLASTALAIATRYMLGAIDDDTKNIATRIKKKQNATSGAFEEFSRDTPTSRRLDLPLCGWVVRALNMVSTEPEHSLRFMRRWNDAAELSWWLGLLEWHRAARRESHRVVNIGMPRILAQHKSSLDAMFAWLDEHQDDVSGFWGAAQGADMTDALGATFYIMLLYLADDRSVPMLDKIVAATLKADTQDKWSAMASLFILKTAKDKDCIEAKEAVTLAEARWDDLSFNSVSSLSELVISLESLRLIAEITEDEKYASARDWNSPWQKELWRSGW